MKHITYADKSLLVGDDEADALMEYARVLADQGRADTVSLTAISTDGNTVEAVFLLNASTIIMIESTNSEVQPPDNTRTVEDLRARIAAINRPAQVEAGDPWADAGLDTSDSH